jgi:hypothetical protein
VHISGEEIGDITEIRKKFAVVKIAQIMDMNGFATK